MAVMFSYEVHELFMSVDEWKCSVCNLERYFILDVYRIRRGIAPKCTGVTRRYT